MVYINIGSPPTCLQTLIYSQGKKKCF